MRLHQGHYERVTRYQMEPEMLGDRLKSAGLRRVHLVDLEGARSGTFQAWDHLARLVRIGLSVEVGGGFRDLEAIAKALDLGATRVVLGSRLVESPAFGEDVLKRFSPRQVVASLDVDLEGRVRVHGWTTSGPEATLWWQTLHRQGFQIANVTDISRDGTLSGIRQPFWQQWTAMPGQIGAGGGIRSLADLELLAALGIHHAVLGKAWLEGLIDLAALARYDPSGPLSE